MCNAYNHKPGCECGFGPPYLSPKSSLPKAEGKEGGGGFISVIRWRNRQKWTSKSILDKNNILKRLSELGVNSKWINSIYKKYVEAGYPLSESQWEEMNKGKQSWAERKLLRSLGLRQEIIAKLEDINLEIPLFRLQPPRTKNSKVSYKESLSKAVGWNIFLEVPGIALGADLSLRIEAGGEIETSEENCKIIFLPVCIKRMLVNLYMGNICIAKKKLIAEAGNKKTGQVNRGVKSCNEYISPSPGAPRIAYYTLSQDLTNDKSVFYIGWGNDKTGNAKLNIPIPGINIGIEVKIVLESELMLEFELAPRHDYELYPTPKELGISWIVDKGVSTPEPA